MPDTTTSSAIAHPLAQSRDPATKQACLIALLCRRRGATMAEMTAATGWQPHSVRSALSRRFRKTLGLAVVSKVVRRRGRVYRIARDIR